MATIPRSSKKDATYSSTEKVAGDFERSRVYPTEAFWHVAERQDYKVAKRTSKRQLHADIERLEKVLFSAATEKQARFLKETNRKIQPFGELETGSETKVIGMVDITIDRQGFIEIDIKTTPTRHGADTSIISEYQTLARTALDRFAAASRLRQ